MVHRHRMLFFHPQLALALSIMMAFFSEAAQHHSEMRTMRQQPPGNGWARQRGERPHRRVWKRPSRAVT